MVLEAGTLVGLSCEPDMQYSCVARGDGSINLGKVKCMLKVTGWLKTSYSNSV